MGTDNDPNNWQRKRISKLIVEKLFNTVNKKKIVILVFLINQIQTIQESPPPYIYARFN